MRTLTREQGKLPWECRCCSLQLSRQHMAPPAIGMQCVPVAQGWAHALFLACLWLLLVLNVPAYEQTRHAVTKGGLRSHMPQMQLQHSHPDILHVVGMCTQLMP